MTYEVTDEQLAELVKIMDDLSYKATHADTIQRYEVFNMAQTMRGLIEQIEMQDVMY